MALIHVYVHGRGRGHASRCVPICETLRARGHTVRAIAGEDAFEVLATVVPTDAVASLPPSLGPASVPRLLARVFDAVARTRAAHADVIVSDGDLPGLLGARLCGVPTVAVGHGLVFAACARPAEAPRGPWLRESLKARLSSVGARRRVAVNFVALPLRARDTVLARPPVRPWPQGHARREIVGYFRDGLDARTAELLARTAGPMRVFARTGPARLPEGITLERPDQAAFTQALAHARAVIASAGSQLMAECVAHGMPLLALYRRDDDEQRLNVHMLQAAGLGRGVPLDALDAPTIAAFLQAPPPGAAAARSLPPGAEAVADACEALLRPRSAGA